MNIVQFFAPEEIKMQVIFEKEKNNKNKKNQNTYNKYNQLRIINIHWLLLIG